MTNLLKTGDPKRVTDKQCRPRSDAAERRVSCLQIQSTLDISNSKGFSEILRDIRTLTYQIYRI